MHLSPIRLFVILGLVAVLFAGGIVYRNHITALPKGADILNFEDCVAAGYPIMESYPRQCRTDEGALFVENLNGYSNKDDLIRVSGIKPNELISSPLTIEGKARGGWFFEASFPVVITDWDGRIIAQYYAEAQSDWMTTEFVSFLATIEFDSPYHAGDPDFMSRGFLILQKDNPSGLPEYDDALEIPIRFTATERPVETGRERGGCIISGCSGQVCADHDVVTTCEYREEYACYEQAVCERQADNACGWTLTAAVGRCLQYASEGDGSVEITGTVRGSVFLGPTCPVVQNPPADECADKPYKTSIEIYDANGGYVASALSGEDGQFSVELAPGTYTVKPQGGSPFPACGQQLVTLLGSAETTVQLSCDTGIR